MENSENKNKIADEEAGGTPAILEKLSKLMAAQNDGIDAKISELSHLNEAETGFNPTPAELAAVHEGIKAQIIALGNGDGRPLSSSS
jgi:hypothetical protein